MTTDEALSEFMNFFAERGEALRKAAVAMTRRILENPNVRVIPQTRQTFLSGLKLYSERLDKGYSLTDCVSITQMRDEGLTEALTNDRHFEQEGFTILLK